MLSEILRLENLVLGYTSPKRNIVLDNINISVKKGELIAILGENGAGKSTLLKCLSGIQKPLSGDIFLKNKNIKDFKHKKYAHQMAVVLTEKIQVPHLLVKDLIALGRFPYNNWLGNMSDEDKKIIEWSMEVTQTTPFKYSIFNTLSDGEKQKVLIARALAQSTPIILLDEPMAHLDYSNKVMILLLLRKLVEENEKTIILITHELNLAIQLATKIWLIHKNSTSILDGYPEDLILSNMFEAIFSSERFTFDELEGHFKIKIPIKGSIKLNATGKYYTWAKNALAKIGYETNSEASKEICFEENTKVWKYENNEFTSLEELFNLFSIREKKE